MGNCSTTEAGMKKKVLAKKVKPQRDGETRHANRRKKILQQIRDEAAVFPAAPEITCSRDQHYTFRQSSDFFYLTGFAEPEAVLVLLGKSRGPRSVLFLRERDATMERWHGERLGLKRAKRRFALDEVRPIADFERMLPELLNRIRVLHYAPGSNPMVDRLVWDLFKHPVGPRIDFPHTLKDSRLLTSQMRSVKDREEIRTLRHACDITADAFIALAPKLAEMKSERHAAKQLESHFARLGGHGVAFPTIVASGKNATVLHHRPQFQPLWQRELVLIDAGASFGGYAADITRTFPASGRFSDAQAKVYDVVYDGLVAGLERAKPGSTLDEIHRATVQAITKGLIDIGVLKGKLPQLVATDAYRKYFMHRTSHWLGLDVHDISPVYFQEHLLHSAVHPLEPGNVFTLEPGLYFDAKDDSVPFEFRGIGVRIEDDVLITSSGAEVLTDRIPAKRSEIEALMKSGIFGVPTLVPAPKP